MTVWEQENSVMRHKTNEATSTTAIAPQHLLDITSEVCPMTFVRTRLALDRLPPGGLLRVRLRGEEPRRSVPASAIALGHEVLERDDRPDGTTELLLRRG